MESVLNNLNALNQSLEGVVAVGKEFQGVSELWQTFYSGVENQLESVEDKMNGDENN